MLYKNAVIIIDSFINYSDQAFETQMFHRYDLNFICILDEICAVANAVRQHLIKANLSPFDETLSRCNLLLLCRAA